jgi:hypothetical protein
MYDYYLVATYPTSQSNTTIGFADQNRVKLFTTTNNSCYVTQYFADIGATNVPGYMNKTGSTPISLLYASSTVNSTLNLAFYPVNTNVALLNVT